jgi:PAS domain S-box-containing protein
MIKPLIPSDEPLRLKALRDYKILDSEAEKEFNEIVQLAAQILNVPISLVSLIDTDRQWFKAKVGLDADETPRDLAFCAHAIHQDDIFIVEDASKDDRFKGNPLVTGAPNIRFYAGMPLINPEGYRIGTLCAIDSKARKLTQEQKFALDVLSKQVIKLLELRLQNLEYVEINTELKDTRDELQSFLDDSSDLIQSVDQYGNFKYVNRSWCQTLGYTQQEALELNIFQIIHPDFHAHCQLQFAELIRDPKSMLIDVVFRSKEGRDIIVEGNVSVHKKDSGAVLTRGIFRDITAKCLVDKEVIRTKRLLEQTNRVAVIGGWEVDLLNKQVYWTEMTMQIHELPADHVLSVDGGIEFYKDGFSREKITEAFNRAVTSGESYDLELQIVTAKGNAKWIRTIGIPEMKDGKCIRIYGTFQDIDQQKKDEAHLRLLESVVLNVNDAIIITKAGAVDKRGPEIVYVNDAFCKMTGYAREEIIGNSPELFHGPEPDEEVISRIRKALQNWESFETEVINYRKNGEKYWVNISIVPLANKEGAFTHWIAIERDVTQQKIDQENLLAAKLQAEQANVAKSEFLANMSHEIRTPLNSVIGFTDLLVKTPLNDNQRNYMQSVHHSANVLLDLINDILDFSKIEAGKLELSVEKTDMYELVSQVSEIVTHKIDSNKVELLVCFDPHLPRYAWVDPVRIRQVLINLLGNAIKFTESGEIELSLSAENPAAEPEQTLLQFSVRDTGIGIPADKQQQIFHAFSQEDSSTTRKYGGTGLGLTISNQLLGLMGSQLSLQSEAGKGSTFFFQLEAKYQHGQPEKLPVLNQYKKVLVVDDHPRNLEIIRQMLSNENIASVTAKNGIEALEAIKSQGDFDVLIIDYHIPYMDGLEIISHIRKKMQLSASRLPILLLHSSEEDSRINQACVDLQIQKAITKPITSPRLLEALSQMQCRVNEPQTIAVAEESSDMTASLLIVDDNKMNRMVAKAMVEKILPRGNILLAESGREALEIYEKHTPQIIFMDIQMPEMSGYEASQAIRAVEEGQPPVIIAFTAGTVKGEKERCLQAGMNDYISKPIVLEDLKTVLFKWIDQYAIETEQHDHHHCTDNRVTFDQPAFEEYFEKNTEMMQLIMSEFVKQLNEFEQDLGKPLTADHTDQLKRSCHKIRSSAASAQMKKLVDLTLCLEEQVQHDPGRAKSLTKDILHEIRVVKKTARGFLDG